MLTIRVLGPLEIDRGGKLVPLPPSRKTRALLTYLAVTDRRHSRERLCRMFWDVPDDPRGALRWSLSKLRRLVDEEGVKRIEAGPEWVAFNAEGARIDFLELKRRTQTSLDALDTDELRHLAESCRGEFLEGLNLSGHYDFHAWCVAEREECRSIELRLRRELVARYMPSDPTTAAVHARYAVNLAPLNEASHIDLLNALLNADRRGEAEDQYRAALDLFARNDLAPPLKLRRIMERQNRRAAGMDAVDPADDDAGHGAESTAEPQPEDLPPPAPLMETPPAAHPAPAEAQPPEAGADRPETGDGPAIGTAQPSIVVLPLRNLSSGADDDYFIDGLTEEIINALSYFRWLPVVSRSTAFLYKNRTFDMRQIARELGVAYVVEGAAIRSPDLVRINYRLIDARQGTQVWAGRIEKPPADIFALQDEVAGQIAAIIEPHVRLAELNTSRRKPPRELAAYDYYLRCLPFIYGPAGMDVEKAVDFLRQALDLDPDYPPAAAMYAWLQTLRSEYIAADERQYAVELARLAANEAKHDASVLALAAPVIAFFERNWDHALLLIDQALALNPNSVAVWSASGWIRTYYGESEQALAHFDRAYNLSPRDPMMYIVNSGRAAACFQLGDYEGAVRHAQISAAENPTFRTNPRIIACSHYYMGREDAAARALERLRRLAPAETVSFVRDMLPYRNRDTAERLADALAALGMPEE